MSMSVSCEGCGLEYAGALQAARPVPAAAQPDPAALPADARRGRPVPPPRPRACWRPSRGGRRPEQTLAQFVRAGRFSRYFVDHFMTPVVACVWSTSPRTALEYPARYLFPFLAHHGMLGVAGSPRWRTVSGGSRSYVDRVAKELSEVLRQHPGRRRAPHRRGRRGRGRRRHASAASTPSSSPPTRTRRCRCSPSRPTPSARCSGRSRTRSTARSCTPTPRCCPSAPRALASWNYRMDACRTRADDVLVTYDMNRLQRLDAARPLPRHAGR